MQSLAHGVPIVTPEFFDAYVKSAREHSQRISSAQLPNVTNFVPEITESDISIEPHMQAVCLDRRRLFENKTFVYMVKHQMERFEHIVSLAGGKCMSMDTEKVKKSF